MDTKCTAYNDWLADSIESSASMPVSLTRHLQNCPTCAAQAAADATLMHAISAWRAHPPQPAPSHTALAQAVLAALPIPAAPVSTTPRSSHSWIALLVASAATIAAILVARSPAPEPVPAVASLPVTDSIEQLLRGIESAPPVVLAAAPVASPTIADWSMVNVVTLTHPAETSSDPTQSITETNDWNRLAAPFNSAFRFLGEALPTTDAG